MRIKTPEEKLILAQHLPPDVVADLAAISRGMGAPIQWIDVEGDKELEKKIERIKRVQA